MLFDKNLRFREIRKIQISFLLALFAFGLLLLQEDALLNHDQDILIASGRRHIISHDELGVLLRAHTQVVELSLVILGVQ